MDAVYTRQQFFAAVAVAILLAGAVGYYLGRSQGRSASDNLGSTETSLDFKDSVALGGKNTVLVNDQAPGNEVAIAQVSLEKSGWIAIHEDKNGAPGNILGARRYPLGISEVSKIELLRPTVKGVYYAMIHTDDGDDEFDYQKDSPLTEGGHPIMARFVVGGGEEL